MRATSVSKKSAPLTVVPRPAVTRPASGESAALRPLEDSLAISLLRAREAVMAHFRPQLLENDLSEPQWRVIRTLADGGELDAGTVAARSCIHASSLSRILRSLQKRRILRTTQSRTDSRRLMVELAPAGRELFDKMAPVSEGIYRRLEETLGRTLIANTLQLVRQIHTELRQEDGV